MGHGNIKCSERLWMIIAIANAVSMSERSDLREASVSAVSARFEWSDYFWHILFHVGMLYLVVLSPFQHICILCSDVVGISMYRLFVMCILYFMYLRLKLGEGVLKNNHILNKKYFESVYINPTYFSLFVPFSFKHQITQLFHVKSFPPHCCRGNWQSMGNLSSSN